MNELLFKSFADPQGKFDINVPVWISATARFLSCSHGRQHKLRSKLARDKLNVVKTVSGLSSVSTGWYYGSRFPREQQVSIDKAILDLRLQLKTQDALIEDNPPLCTGVPSETSIKPGEMG